MKGNKRNAIGSLVFAVIFAVVGIIAYANDYIILLFRIIPLNGLAFGIIAVLLLAFAIYQLATASKKDQAATQAFQEQTAGTQQAAMQNAGATSATALATPCTVNVAHVKGMLGAVNHFNVMLNGFEAGILKNKKTLSFTTNIAENSLGLQHSNTGQVVTFPFKAVSGGTVNLSVTISMTGAVSIEQA
jgi:hypothetical protein